MSVGEQKIPAVKLVGENTNSLIEFSALMATPEAPAHLEVARDNVRWATEQFQQALQQLDQQQLGQIDGQLAARNVTSRPEVPQNLSASVHAAIDPRRVASLLA